VTGDVTSKPARRVTALIVGPVAVALALLIFLMATSDPAAERANRSAVLGELAPLIEGRDLDDQWFSIDDYRGQWVVVNFFSTTCIPCIVEHPELVEFSERHAIVGDAVVVSVAFDDSTANVRDFFVEHGGNWPVLTGDTGSFAVAYGVTAVPESYLVAPTGLVVSKLIGGVTADGLDAQITQLLAEADQ